MVLGVCRIALYFAESNSLKAKRGSLRRIIERVKSKFNAAAAEVGEQDSWQRASVGFCVVGNDESHVDSMVDGILGFIEQLYLGQILDVERELLHYSQQERLGPAGLPRAPGLVDDWDVEAEEAALGATEASAEGERP